MTQTLKAGDYVVADGKLMQVERFSEPGETRVHYNTNNVSGVPWAEIHRSPLQVGTRVYRLFGGEGTVTGLEERVGEIRVWFKEDDTEDLVWGDYESLLHRIVPDQGAETVTEKQRTEPFATGSVVRFRQDLEYLVKGFDGELHELEAVDSGVSGDDLNRLHFGPEFFELVEHPPLEPGTLVEYRGERYLVDWARGEHVELTDRVGDGKTLSRAVFDEEATVLLR